MLLYCLRNDHYHALYLQLFAVFDVISSGVMIMMLTAPYDEVQTQEAALEEVIDTKIESVDDRCGTNLNQRPLQILGY